MEFREWLDAQLTKRMSEDIVAFNFNLYECNDDTYDVQLVGCLRFDRDDPDWACEEAFTSGEDVYHLSSADWECAQQTVIDWVRAYLNRSGVQDLFHDAQYITVGFVDGDLEVILER